MRRRLLLAATALAVLGSSLASAAADELQWRRRQQASYVAEQPPASTRTAARFRRPSIAERAKRATPAEPSQLPRQDARPIQQPERYDRSRRDQRSSASPPGGRIVFASQHSRVRRAAAQLPEPGANGGSAPNSEPVPSDAETITTPEGQPFPYTESYIEGQPYVEGGACCDVACGCPAPACGCEAPVCGCPAGECACGVPACGCPAGECTCAVPACGCPAGECGCGDVVCGDGWGWGPVWFGGCVDRGAIPLCIYIPPIKEVALFGGVHGFKGSLDRDRDRGNFGFHEGINVGGRMSWLPWPGLGDQVGYQATHSQFHGTDVGMDGSSHTQSFLTAGLFRRNFCGVQYGVVYDLLSDERIESADFSQVRGLISVTNPKGGEIGFMFAASSDDKLLDGTLYRPNDQFLGFWRYHGPSGGEFRCYAGGGDGHGILGSDIFAPLNDSWSLHAGFTYMIPDDSAGPAAASEEAWNVGINLVWHCGCGAKRWFKSPWRPLFNVANNGSFIVDNVD